MFFFSVCVWIWENESGRRKADLGMLILTEKMEQMVAVICKILGVCKWNLHIDLSSVNNFFG